MARLCKGSHFLAPVTYLKDNRGVPQSCPSEIIKILEAFYSALYAHDLIDQSVASTFLDNFNLSAISPSQLESLNAPITQKEKKTDYIPFSE